MLLWPETAYNGDTVLAVTLPKNKTVRRVCLHCCSQALLHRHQARKLQMLMREALQIQMCICTVKKLGVSYSSFTMGFVLLFLFVFYVTNMNGNVQRLEAAMTEISGQCLL